MNRPASVTMNDGRPVRITIEPLRQPIRQATANASRMHSQSGQPQHRRDRDDHAGGADHRADRQVELAADHQHRHGDRDDAELGRDLEEVDDARRRNRPLSPATIAKKRKTRIVPATAPSSGRAISLRSSGVAATRSSRRC